MKAENCALILLASGLSERFGAANKLMADLNGRPVLSHVIESLSPLSFGKKFAVVSGDKGVSGLLDPAGFNCIFNPSPERGQGNSLSIGAKAVVSEGWEKAVIVLGDMPFVGTDHIRNLIHMCEGQEIIMSESNGIKMPPALFCGNALKGLCRASGDEGGKSTAHNIPVVTLPLSARAARDIDTLEDLAASR